MLCHSDTFLLPPPSLLWILRWLRDWAPGWCSCPLHTEATVISRKCKRDPFTLWLKPVSGFAIALSIKPSHHLAWALRVCPGCLLGPPPPATCSRSSSPFQLFEGARLPATRAFALDVLSSSLCRQVHCSTSYRHRFQGHLLREALPTSRIQFLLSRDLLD